MNTMIALAVLLTILIFIVAIFKAPFMNWYDEVVTHETTTTTSYYEPPKYDVVGDLEKLHDEVTMQPYVVDPVDQQRWNLNTLDDLYEDAAGKVWRLV